jgi:catechol 2,3-dioxygenase-like lactoylglutathione lyase family enzyme
MATPMIASHEVWRLPALPSCASRSVTGICIGSLSQQEDDMTDRIDNLMDRYDRGTLTRRQLVKGLLLLAMTPHDLSAAEQAPPRALAPALAFNHIHIGVSDHEKSAQFYSAIFGCKIKDKGTGSVYKASEHLWTMTLPGSKPDLGAWFSMDESKKPGTIDHIALSVELPDPAAAKRLASDINTMFPSAKARPGGYADPKGRSPHRLIVSVTDPDGLNVSLHSKKDDGWLPTTVPKSDF